MAAASATAVLTLKQRVPANCTAADHQSARSARFVWLPRRPTAAEAHWMNPAAVKKSEPTKNVTPTTTGPAQSA